METKKSKKRLSSIQKCNKIGDINVNKILVSKKEPYRTKNSFKYFIGYNDNDVIRPLCIKLPQMTGYVRLMSLVVNVIMIKIMMNLTNNLLKGKKVF